MKDLLRFARSVRHTRPRQLAARLRRILRREGRELFARALPACAVRSAIEVPELAHDLPQPLFAPRRHMVSFHQGERYARFLGLERRLEPPLDWHPDESAEGGAQLARLHLHYMEYLEALEDESLISLVDDWIARNRPCAPRAWYDGWSPYAISIRCVVWMQQIALRRGALPQDFVARASASLAGQIRHLRRDLETDLGGNHLVKNVKALLWGGAFFAGEEARTWTKLGERLLARELGEQVLEDGMHFERSPAYHAQVLADLLECRSVLEDSQVAPALDVGLERMAQALADLTHPDGGISLFNDGGLHMAYAPAQVLAVFERLRGERPKPRSTFALASAGFFGVRDEQSLFIVDCGAIAPDHLPAHGHGDALSFEWTAGKRRIVVDAGVSEYAPGSWRDWSRSTRAHNTVTVDDADQCEFWKSFRIGRRARVTLERYEAEARGFLLQGSHDGFTRLRGEPRHRRLVRATPRSIEVEDEIQGGSGQAVRARLLLHPEVNVHEEQGGLLLRCGEFRARLDSSAPTTVETSWWCPNLGERIATTQIVLHYGQAPCRGSFRLEQASFEAAHAAQASWPAKATP